MDYCPDHPEIQWAESTGYPSWQQEPNEPKWTCEECGIALEADNAYEDEDHELLCEECLLTLHKKEYLE